MKKLIDREERPLSPTGENTYGLKVYRDVFQTDKGEEIHWNFDLPDGLVVFPITDQGEVVAIRRWRPGVGEYPQLPAESLEPGEVEELRRAIREDDEIRIPAITEKIAKRCLQEETGYSSERIRLLTTISQYSGKTPAVHCFCLAEGCFKTTAEGPGEKDEGITLLPLAKPDVIWKILVNYLRDRPGEIHGGKNSIVGVVLALQELGMLHVSGSRNTI